jgi:predicted dinucleotide-binding enzyme
MKNLQKLMVAAAVLATFGTVSYAKCFKFSNKGGDVGVCVPGDSTDSRKLAKKICDEKEGNCGSVSSSMSRCHSNVGKCYDENGNASRDVSR